jgi:DNA-binding NtrC family response regulator
MAKILIVDDEPKIRRILTVVLRDRGHEVFDVGTGEEGVDSTRTFHPDVILLDLNLPGIDGLEVLRRLQGVEGGHSVIMMTAHGSISSAVEAMRRGAYDYLTKPFDNDEVLILIDRVMEVHQLSTEVAELRGELESRYGFSEIIGISPPMQNVFRTMAKVARVNAGVLITGESGTGKELVARAVHRRSERSRGPFIAVNCSAIPATLVESEFFGHERGAFTDARDARAGSFEQAHGGTLFLDEIGDLALEAQAKLLRALQERTITRVGGRGAKEVDVRVIAATNKDLEAEVKAGAFREDLYWRLNIVPVHLPPLRERSEDLPLLFDHFLNRFNRELGLNVKGIAPEARSLLMDYHWSGNVREMENTLCRAMILCEGEILQVEDLPARVTGSLAEAAPDLPSDLHDLPLAEAVQQATERLEKVMILARLAEHRGSRTATAESLGVSRKTLFNKMRSYGLGDEDLE